MDKTFLPEKYCYNEVKDKIDQWLLNLQKERKCTATNSVCKVVQNLSCSDKMKVKKIISDEIYKLMNKPKNETTIRHACNVINGCFDNFPIAVEAVDSILYDIFIFICEWLKNCKDFLSQTFALNVTKVEACDIIHNLSRLGTLILKLRRWNPNQPVGDKNDSINLINSFKSASICCTSLICLPDSVAIDTKINLAMMLWLMKEVADLDRQSLIVLHGEFLASLVNGTKGSFLKFVMAAAAVNLYSEPLINAPESVQYLEFFLSLCQNNSSDTPLLLMGCRSLQVVAKHKSFVHADISPSVAAHVVTAVFMLLEHPVPCVRHSGRDLLQLVVKIPPLYSAIETEVLHQSSDRKCYFIGLAALGTISDTRRLVELTSCIPESLMVAVTDPTVASHVCFAIERLALSDSLVKNDFEDWCNVWVMPLLHILPGCASIVAGDIEKVLYKIFKHFPNAIEIVLNKWKDADSDEKLRGVLFCLKIRNKLKGDGAQFVDLITGQKGVNCILEVCLSHRIDDVRMSALTLIIEGATLSEQDLRLVLYFLRYNLNNHRPSTRQKVSAFFKKLISRVNSCYLNSLRSTKSKETAVASSVYEQFVADLVNLCYENIFGGANFNRMNTVLNVLLMCKETLNVQLTAVAGVCAANRWSTLLVALASSYEENKAIAVSLAASLPLNEMSLNEPFTLRLEFRRAFGLVQELEPPNVLLGSYLLCVLIRVPNACLVLRQYFADCIESPACVTDVLCIQVLSRYLTLQLEEARQSKLTAAKQAPMYGTLFAIRLIFNSLQPSALKSAESIKVLQDLVETSFGMADAVSSVVNNSSPEGHLPMDFQNLLAEGKKEGERTHFVERPAEEPLDDVNGLIHRYKSAGTPEQKLLLAGWIRNRLEAELDLQNIHDAQWPVLDPNADTWYHQMHETQALLAEYDCYHKFFLGHLPRVIEEPPVTAQALLLYSWRSMKEACLYLGDLASKLPLQQAMEDGLLSEDIVTRIGLRLRELLSEIKHRGAFENVDIGFSAVCLALWKCPQSSLHALPSLWLKEIMQELVLPPEQQSLKFTSTRRSAGLPFLVKTIVATELISNYSSSANALQTTLVELLDIAESFKSDNIEPRLHALNILRALFKHTQLGEFVTPYVSRALQIAIEGSRSVTWPERNCSNLLFSTLFIRIFGVSRSRDHLSRKNKMTSRLFFQRFPDLYEFLLKEMTTTANEESKVGFGVKAQPSLYLVLLLISRLFPPTTEDASSVDLTPFVRVMAQCAGNPIMRIRVLAARALVPFLPPHLIILELKWRLRILNTRRAKSNLLHGLLLQVVELLDELRNHELLMGEVQNLEIPTWMLPNRMGDGLSPLSLAGVQMMTVMCRFYPNHPCQPIKTVLTAKHWPEYVYYSKKRLAGADVCLAGFAALQVMCLLKEVAATPSELNALLRLKDCGLSAVEDVLLQCIYCIFTPPAERDADFDFSLTEGLMEVIELLSSYKSLDRIKSLINSSSLANSEILSISRTGNLQQRRLRILNYSNLLMEATEKSQKWSSVFNLISIYGSHWDGDGIVRLLNEPADQVELTDAIFGRVGAAMVPLLDGDKPCRMVLANIYLRANVYLMPNSNNLGIEYRRYWLNLFYLLLDEEEDVRKVAQAAVNKITAQISNIESVRSMTSLGSQEMLLQYYKRIVCRANPCVDILLMALLTVCQVTEQSSSQTLELFKRGNPNPYSECVALTRLFISEAQNCVDDDALNQPFPGGDMTNKQIYTQLSPHFACYGLRLKPFTLPGQLLDELKRLEQPDNADVDEFWWQIKQILTLSPPKH